MCVSFEVISMLMYSQKVDKVSRYISFKISLAFLVDHILKNHLACTDIKMLSNQRHSRMRISFPQTSLFSDYILDLSIC